MRGSSWPVFISSFILPPSSFSFVPPLQRLHNLFRVDAARAFDEDEVAGADEGGERPGGLFRRVEEARRLRMHARPARRLDERERVPAHPPKHFDAEAGDLAPRLAVKRLRLRAQLKH